MKKIIVLSGVGGSGKSTTIHRLYEELSGNEHKRKEVIESFEYNGKKIAIISIGDLLELIEEYFREIGDFDILICACRSRGATLTFYKNKRGNGYDVEFIDKHKPPTPEEEEEIILKIKKIISNSV